MILLPFYSHNDIVLSLSILSALSYDNYGYILIISIGFTIIIIIGIIVTMVITFVMTAIAAIIIITGMIAIYNF